MVFWPGMPEAQADVRSQKLLGVADLPPIHLEEKSRIEALRAVKVYCRAYGDRSSLVVL